MSPDNFLLFVTLSLLTAGAAVGGLTAYIVMWLYLRKESYKDCRHYRLLGWMKVHILVFWLSNLGLVYYLTHGFDRWIEAFLFFVFAFMAWTNFKRARMLAPR